MGPTDCGSKRKVSYNVVDVCEWSWLVSCAWWLVAQTWELVSCLALNTERWAFRIGRMRRVGVRIPILVECEISRQICRVDRRRSRRSQRPALHAIMKIHLTITAGTRLFAPGTRYPTPAELEPAQDLTTTVPSQANRCRYRSTSALIDFIFW